MRQMILSVNFMNGCNWAHALEQRKPLYLQKRISSLSTELVSLEFISVRGLF
jgi:hypothetical protein